MPVYNGEKYLRPAIESVIGQSYSDWELLLIDDGSTDDTAAIADKYACENNKIRVFHRPNSGVSTSRNFGLTQAAGDWIYFLDADDIIHPRMLEIMYGAAERYDLDLVVCHYKTFSKDPEIEQIDTAQVQPHIGSGQGMYHFLITQSDGTSLWVRLFKKSLTQHSSIEFNPQMSFGEDMFVSWKLSLVSNRTGYIGLPLYNYRMVPGSAVAKYHKDLYELYKSAFDDILYFGQQIDADIDVLNHYRALYFADRLPALLRMEVRAPYSRRKKLERIAMIQHDPLMLDGFKIKNIQYSSPAKLLRDAQIAELKFKLKNLLRQYIYD